MRDSSHIKMPVYDTSLVIKGRQHLHELETIPEGVTKIYLHDYKEAWDLRTRHKGAHTAMPWIADPSSD